MNMAVLKILCDSCHYRKETGWQPYCKLKCCFLWKGYKKCRLYKYDAENLRGVEK